MLPCDGSQETRNAALAEQQQARRLAYDRFRQSELQAAAKEAEGVQASAGAAAWGTGSAVLKT